MDTMRTLCSVPIVTIDEVLFEEAVAAGERLGVIATGERSCGTTARALEAEAARRGRTLHLLTRAVPEAFAALVAGDPAAHDARVATTVRELAGTGVEAIVLAQASLSRALPMIGDLAVPVLTSPRLAVGRVKRLLSGLTPTTFGARGHHAPETLPSPPNTTTSPCWPTGVTPTGLWHLATSATASN
jgi:Asp/Glu/hydantoin racemase